jgi:hypothetical protein
MKGEGKRGGNVLLSTILPPELVRKFTFHLLKLKLQTSSKPTSWAILITLRSVLLRSSLAA